MKTDDWPHGRPTIICPHCHGTGMSRGEAAAYLSSRAALGDALREAAVRCTTCEGRGRLTHERALARGIPAADIEFEKP